MSTATRLGLLKDFVAALSVPPEITIAELGDLLSIAQEMSYELWWSLQGYQNQCPEFYEVENMWDGWANEHEHDHEAELEYGETSGAWTCDGVTLGRTLKEAIRLFYTWQA